jgi:hypothetical protein
MGALCGLFVVALVAKANIGAINSIGVLLPVVLYGSVGFHFGTSIPSLPSGASGCSLSDGGSGPKATPIALASAAGTFLAAVTRNRARIELREEPLEECTLTRVSCLLSRLHQQGAV